MNQGQLQARIASCSTEISARDVLVGHDVLELLTSAMYLDPLTIYREYVQNAADSIDEAREIGALGSNEAGIVEIDIDNEERTIRIRDNGTGVPISAAPRVLTAIGASTKREKSARGFRGIGRLAGLGYCRELIFRTRAPGDSHVFEMTWDGHKLKDALRPGGQISDLAALVAEIVSAGLDDSNEHPSRFFEVELRGVIRHSSESLLSIDAVSSYLSEVAPVPFSRSFKFGQEIEGFLAKHSVEVTGPGIYLNGCKRPLCRPHRNSFLVSETEEDKFSEIEYQVLEGVEGEAAAIGWVLHHGYKGALPKRAKIRGLRARMGNMQVGGSTLFEAVFPEPRFNQWTVGEVHVLDARIVPNGRRDHFEQNIHLKTLESRIAPVARSIARRCRDSSIRRNTLRAVTLRNDEIQENYDLLRTGALPTPRAAAAREALNAAFDEIERLLKRGVLTEKDSGSWNARAQSWKQKLTKLSKIDIAPASLRRMSKTRREAYQEVFGLIHECSASTAAAKTLIERILARAK